MASIQRDEWLRAVNAAESSDMDNSALTTRELGELLGKSRDAMRNLLPKLLEQGTITKTQKRIRGQIVPAYRLTGK